MTICRALLGCVNCGKLFKGSVYEYGYTDKTCSQKCMQEVREKKFETVKCKVCGKTFRAYKCLKRTCCSRACVVKLPRKKRTNVRKEGINK